MKAKNLLLSAVVLASMVGGQVITFAAYDGATKATSDATIEFEKNTDPIPPTDPDNPLVPIEPENPGTNPGVGNFGIVYASNLNFGKQSNAGTSWNALADKDKNGKVFTPMVSVADLRGSERVSWSLTVKQDGEFKNSKSDILKGAELTYSNLYYTDAVGAPKVTPGNVVLSTTAQEIASAGKDNGIGQWPLALGHLQGEEDSKTTNGVTLTVPSTTIKEEGSYKTTVTYELLADPTK